MTDLEKIKKILKKYSVKEAYLFGSFKDDPGKAKDIDLAISLDNAGEFFRISSALSMALQKPLDLIDLTPKCKFNDFIKKNGLKIYVKNSRANRSGA